MLRRVLRTTACGAVVGAAIGGYMYRSRLTNNKQFSAEDFNKMQDVEAVRRQISALMSHDPTAHPVELYRYTTCPFCSKVRAFLLYHKVQHTCVEVEPMFKNEIKAHNYGKVPQLKFPDGNLLVDSDLIIDALSEHIHDKQWQDQMARPDVQKWRTFARESLVRYLVVNINTTLYEAWRGYEYVDSFESIPMMNKVVLKMIGAPVMYLVSQYKTIPHLQRTEGYDPLVVDAPSNALRQQLQSWVQEGLGTKKFQGGSAPNIADIEIYGVLQSVRGHRIYNDIIAQVPGMKSWLENMDVLLVDTTPADHTMQQIKGSK